MQDELSKIYGILSGAAAPTAQQMGVLPFLFLMLTSLAASLLASFLYLRFYSTRVTGSQVHRSFPLLGISVTAIFVCIQFSLPLSLGLLGALSIVRFRTPIKEPEEIGFIMLVIATSIATATFKLAFVAVIFVVAVIALLVQTLGRRSRQHALDGTIVVEVPGPGDADGTALAGVLKTHLPDLRLESIARNDGHVVYAYQFRNVSPGNLLALQAELGRSGPAPIFNVFLNRPAAL